MNEKIMQTELQQKQATKISQILPAPGVGFGTIGVDSFERKSRHAKEMINTTREIINRGECMSRCDHQDDGCIDGRCVDEIAAPEHSTFSVKNVESNEGNERAKVAGGGYVTGLAMFKAIGEDLVSPDADLAFLSENFARDGIYCGAHTGSHGSEPKQTTDCGANDRFDQILATAMNNREPVSQVTRVLVGPLIHSYNEDVLHQDVNNWQHVITETDNFSHSNGISRLDVIREGILSAQDSLKTNEKVSVIKHLAGNHNEVFLIVNYAKGLTFSQTKLRQKLLAQYPDIIPDDLPQVFALDMWRVDQLAHAVAALPEKNSGRNRSDAELKNRYEHALLAGTAYQVATYLTLTNGSLPVVVIDSAA